MPMKIEVRFQVDEEWVPTKDALSSPEFSEVSVGSAIYTKNIILGLGGGTPFKSPFRPDTKEGTCLITIHPSVDAYNIGLPTLFGEIDLQPIEHEYNIEVESEYLEQVFSDRFPEYQSSVPHKALPANAT